MKIHYFTALFVFCIVLAVCHIPSSNANATASQNKTGQPVVDTSKADEASRSTPGSYEFVTHFEDDFGFFNESAWSIESGGWLTSDGFLKNNSTSTASIQTQQEFTAPYRVVIQFGELPVDFSFGWNIDEPNQCMHELLWDESSSSAYLQRWEYGSVQDTNPLGDMSNSQVEIIQGSSTVFVNISSTSGDALGSFGGYQMLSSSSPLSFDVYQTGGAIEVDCIKVTDAPEYPDLSVSFLTHADGDILSGIVTLTVGLNEPIPIDRSWWDLEEISSGTHYSIETTPSDWLSVQLDTAQFGDGGYRITATVYPWGADGVSIDVDVTFDNSELEVYFEDSFDSYNAENWEIIEGGWNVSEGYLVNDPESPSDVIGTAYMFGGPHRIYFEFGNIATSFEIRWCMDHSTNSYSALLWDESEHSLSLLRVESGSQVDINQWGNSLSGGSLEIIIQENTVYVQAPGCCGSCGGYGYPAGLNSPVEIHVFDNGQVQIDYVEVTAAPDYSSVQVNFETPLNGDTVSGVATLRIGTSRTIPVDHVEWFVESLEGGGSFHVDSNPNDWLQTSWDTSQTADGQYRLTASLYPWGGDSIGTSIEVVVDNGGSAWSVNFVHPHEGDTVSGSDVYVAIETSYGVEFASMQVKCEFTNTAYNLYEGSSTSFSWNTTQVQDGQCTLKADVEATDGTHALAQITVLVANRDYSDYDVTMDYPNGGEILSGTPQISWSANIPSEHGSEEYMLEYSDDGGGSFRLIATDLSFTYYNWDTTQVPDGANYLLRVTLMDTPVRDTTDGLFEICNNNGNESDTDGQKALLSADPLLLTTLALSIAACVLNKKRT